VPSLCQEGDELELIQNAMAEEAQEDDEGLQGEGSLESSSQSSLQSSVQIPDHR
jgi:hypothetical protein